MIYFGTWWVKWFKNRVEQDLCFMNIPANYTFQ